MTNIGNPAMLYQHKLSKELFTEKELSEEDEEGDGGAASVAFDESDFHDFRKGPILSPKAAIAAAFFKSSE